MADTATLPPGMPPPAGNRKRERMKDRELCAIIDAKIESSPGREKKGGIVEERKKALEYYRGEPFGNERANRSQVVSHDVAEAIESIMPSLMDIFASGETAVKFEPRGQEDEEAAEQATDYVNHIFYQRNPGFAVLYTWFKDALLQKNGTIKIWWDEQTETVRENYTGLSPEARAAVVDAEGIEVLAEDELETELGTFYDLEVRRTKKSGRVCIENVPPENFLVDLKAVREADAPFSGERYTRTLSELIEMGFDRKRVMDLPAGSTIELDSERRDRERGQERDDDALDADPSMREVDVDEVYIRADYDGDGVAELRKVIKVGNTILENEEVEHNPYACLCPVPMPHVFFGRSVADQTMDVQLVKSTLMRGILDNIYLTNDPRTEIPEPAIGADTIDDYLNSRPGGVVRTKLGGMMQPLAVPFTAQHSFPILEYLDTVFERRTGAFRHSEGPDANALAATATGANMIENTAQRRVKLIARVFAETGVKRAFRLILNLVTRYQDQQDIIRLRNRWVPMDPRHWNADMDLTATVGLGTGNKDQQVAHATNILSVQAQMLEGGMTTLVQPKNLYNAAEKLVEASGFRIVEDFFTDPDSPQGQQAAQAAAQRPDPQMLEVQGKLQLEREKAQADVQADQVKMHTQAQTDIQKMQMEFQLKREQMQMEIQLKREQLAAELQLKRELAMQEMAIQREIGHANAAIKAQQVNSSQVRPGGAAG